MLQYEETTGAWSEIGKMKKARNYHAAVEVDVSLFCPGWYCWSDKSEKLVITTIATTIICTILSSLNHTCILLDYWTDGMKSKDNLSL